MIYKADLQDKGYQYSFVATTDCFTCISILSTEITSSQHYKHIMKAYGMFDKRV